MTIKYNRDSILKNTFFDVRLAERTKQLQGWLTNVVSAVEPKTQEEALRELMTQKRKPLEPSANKIGVHNMRSTLFGHREQPQRQQLDPKPTDDKKSGPKNP